MQIHSGIIRYQENEIHVLRMGNGSKLLITLHGFGNTASIFEPIAAAFLDDYTTVSIDLPGHGLTKWKNTYFEKKDLMAIIESIKTEFKVEQFTLMGFSLGGRLSLNITDLQPNWIDKLILLAPDGLEKHFWYHAATRNPLGKFIFKKMMHNPDAWIKPVEKLRKWNIIDASRFKFIKANLTDEKIRHQLSYVWPVTSRLVVNIQLVKWNIKKYKVETHLFMGSHDRIFPPQQGERFIKGLKTATLHILNEGHNLINGKLIAELKRIL